MNLDLELLIHTLSKPVSPDCSARRVSVLPVGLAFHLVLRSDHLFQSKPPPTDLIKRRRHDCYTTGAIPPRRLSSCTQSVAQHDSLPESFVSVSADNRFDQSRLQEGLEGGAFPPT